jgi:hypothetical protein
MNSDGFEDNISETNNYKDINDIISRFDLDMSHWINAEVASYAKYKEFEERKVESKQIPKELLSHKLKCPNNHHFKPNWLEKRFPTSVFITKDFQLIRQSTCFTKCSVCNELAVFPIPDVEYRQDLDIFGDEAMRTVNNKTIFVYSFVSFSGGSEDKKIFEEKFLNLKKLIAPSIDPCSWVLHMKELLSGKNRAENAALSHLHLSEVMDCISKIIELIRSYNEKNILNLYSSVGIAEGINQKGSDKIKCQEEVYSASLIRVIEETTGHGLAPKFYFEQTGSDGWAKNLFHGWRMTLVWPWITRGLPVMSPKFVDPSFSLYLEIADILSYMVARHLFCIGRRVEGENIKAEICPSSFGLVRYILLNSRGDGVYHNSVGFPDLAMFKGTHWRKYI